MEPLQPGETCVYPWMLSPTQIPVLDLTNTKITSTTELEKAFHTLNVKEEYCYCGEDTSTEECPK